MRIIITFIACLLIASCSKESEIPVLTETGKTVYIMVRNNIAGEEITIIKHVTIGDIPRVIDVCKIKYQATSPVVELSGNDNTIILTFRLSSKQYVSVHDFETVEYNTHGFKGENSKNNPIKVALNKYESGMIYLESIN
jgi:hypothetical protein